MRGQSLRPQRPPGAAAPPALQVPAVDGGPAVQEVPAQLRVAHLGSQDQRRGAVLAMARGRMSRGGSDLPMGQPAPGITPISVSHPSFHDPPRFPCPAPISMSHPKLCGVSGQPQPGKAGPGAQGPHLVLAVQGSLEVTEDLGAGDAAAGSCGQGQRLSAALRGTRAGQGWHCPYSPARCSAVRPLPSATSTGQEAWGESLGHGRRGTEGQTARVALWTVKDRGLTDCVVW